MLQMANKTRIVLPGEKIGVEELFFPGSNCWLREGDIFATVAGILEIDQDTRCAHVRPLLRTVFLEKGSSIYAEVAATYAHYAILRCVRDLKAPWEWLTGVIDLNADRRRLRSNILLVKVGDVVRCEYVGKRVGGYPLFTLIGRKNGVLIANCDVCRAPLIHIGRGRMRCPRCGNRETRKASEDYLYTARRKKRIR